MLDYYSLKMVAGIDLQYTEYDELNMVLCWVPKTVTWQLPLTRSIQIMVSLRLFLSELSQCNMYDVYLFDMLFTYSFC